MGVHIIIIILDRHWGVCVCAYVCVSPEEGADWLLILLMGRGGCATGAGHLFGGELDDSRSVIPSLCLVWRLSESLLHTAASQKSPDPDKWSGFRSDTKRGKSWAVQGVK